MPRTSRRYGMHKKDEKCRAALYARISVDDGSDSLENQLELLRSYAKRKNINIYKEYVDIGKTGTNFFRDGFKHPKSLRLKF